ncbi:MAG TPA: ABC transporter permease [Burkholderiales bacterium]|nr:ABC transporter permease [Burkholderiales bacterium]
MKRILRGALLPALGFFLWETGSRAGLLPIDTFSRPSDIAQALAGGLVDGTILLATWQTVQAALSGFAVAAAAGILVGAILGLSPPIERTVGPSIEALRPIPAVALMPLTLLFFGFGLRMEAGVVAFACIWPILLVTVAAVRGIEPRLLEVAQTLRLGFAARLRKIILPAALGRIVVGLRVAVSISLIVAVTVEIVMNPYGLGYGMIIAQQSLKPDLMYAQLLWLGLLGWGLNALLTRALGGWHGAFGPGVQP